MVADAERHARLPLVLRMALHTMPHVAAGPIPQVSPCLKHVMRTVSPSPQQCGRQIEFQELDPSQRATHDARSPRWSSRTLPGQR